MTVVVGSAEALKDVYTTSMTSRAVDVGVHGSLKSTLVGVTVGKSAVSAQREKTLKGNPFSSSILGVGVQDFSGKLACKKGSKGLDVVCMIVTDSVRIISPYERDITTLLPSTCSGHG